MKKSLLNELHRLEKAKVINADVSAAIKAFYVTEQSKSNTRLYTVFSILGACLIGLGIILLIAHNWDDLSRSVKTLLAIFPLISGQIICIYVLRKKSESGAWVEGSSVFLFFAIGAAISLISQIYNIPGNLANFLFVWMILSLPIIYLLRSSMVSLLYLIGISWFVCESAYWSYSDTSEYFYWLLLLAVIPDYYFLLRSKPLSNFTRLYSWFVPLSITLALGMIHSKHEEWLFVAYMALFSIFYLFGNLRQVNDSNVKVNSFTFIGSIGSIVILLMLSFDWFWLAMERENPHYLEIFTSREFILSVLLTVFSLGLFVFSKKDKAHYQFHPFYLLSGLFFVLFMLGYQNGFLVQVLINVSTLGLGLFYVFKGSRSFQLTQMNFGLLIITALIVCRFFDTNITFIVRGLLFIAIGVGFFMLNYRLLKKRPNEAGHGE